MKSKILPRVILALLITGTIAFSCKKTELERLPLVVTIPPTNITDNSATAHGLISDLGDGEVSKYGFCYVPAPDTPTVQNAGYYYEKLADTGLYSINITGLSAATKYNHRAYMVTSQGPVYGRVVEFWTGGTGSGNWYFYDDGYNFNSIGLTGGGNFTAAIRLYMNDLPSQSSLRITKISFYVTNDLNTDYELAIRTLIQGTTYLEYSQPVNGITGTYAEYELDDPFEIPEGIDGIYAGYFVADPFGFLPAGIDAGPANPDGNGDKILIEGENTWENLSDFGWDNNWNIQVYIENSKGEEFMYVPGKKPAGIIESGENAGSNIEIKGKK
ncbi:MAG: hypothetical protein R6T99_00345 [Bacteroidales bacterium]